MTLAVTWKTEAPGNLIRSARWNTNFTDIETWANAHEVATTGVHGVGAGAVMGTTLAQTITGAKTFSGADVLIITGSTPTAARSIGYYNRAIHFYDSNASAVYDYPPLQMLGAGLYNIAFAQGSDSSQLKITGANGAALGATNPGYVRMPSSTANTWRTFTVTSDVTMDLTGAHWGLDGKGDVTGALLRVYSIDDNGTLVWGVGYCGGFQSILNTQDDTTATNINLPEEIFTSGDVATSGSPMMDCGYIKGNFTDSSNEWALTTYYPNRSADGVWQPWSATWGGFSATPTNNTLKWMQVGKTITVDHKYVGSGTSNATTFTMTLPIKSGSLGSTQTGGDYIDNGAATTGPVILLASSNSVTLNLYKTYALGGWTNANAKVASYQYTYEMYQP